jgi:phosphate uptake regulator
VNLLFVAQAFERAGDHAKNLGEELFHLVEGRSLRHEPKRSKTRSGE